MASVVCMRGSGVPLVEPDERCEACGHQGTVSHAVRFRDSEMIELHRFCASCWPEESARYGARWKEQDRLAMEASMRDARGMQERPSMGTAMETATWHGVLELLELVTRWRRNDSEEDEAGLAAMAADFVKQAPEKIGPMPFMVEMFIRKYGPKPGAIPEPAPDADPIVKLAYAAQQLEADLAAIESEIQSETGRARKLEARAQEAIARGDDATARDALSEHAGCLDVLAQYEADAAATRTLIAECREVKPQA